MVKSDVEVLAVIPARGGSKSIPHKNTKLLGGHPLIAYSIAAGLQAGMVNRVLVSTDDEAIARIAREYGADVPFIRPAELAGDDVLDLPVFEHVLEWLDQREGYRPDVVVQLRPTSPIRPPRCVDEALSILLSDPSADSVRAVTPAGQNPYKMWRLEDGRLAPLIQTDFEEPYNMPRQKLPAAFWQTGHIDVIRRQTIIEKQSLTGSRVLPIMISPEYAVDIDTLEQWEQAEWVLSYRSFETVKPTDHREFDDIRMVVFDFDGVLTDNRVYVIEDGREAVACNRSDGLGIEALKEFGVSVVVLSTEANPVVAARCKKLGLACYQGARDKAAVFESLISEKGLTAEQVVYVGNDVNDLDCMRLAGWSVAVADAYQEVLAVADLVLTKPGGQGAARELCDLLVSRLECRRKAREYSNA